MRWNEGEDPYKQLADRINTEIEAWGINLRYSLEAIWYLLLIIMALGIAALVHFW
jgi:hypothetical protein